jgi:hypothetical protein
MIEWQDEHVPHETQNLCSVQSLFFRQLTVFLDRKARFTLLMSSSSRVFFLGSPLEGCQ